LSSFSNGSEVNSEGFRSSSRRRSGTQGEKLLVESRDPERKAFF
jgi:hypothetical protein